MSDDDLPDINVTRGEKALAAVLVVFLLIGGLWMYFVPLSREAATPQPTPSEQRAIDAHEDALAAHRRAEQRRNERERTYERAREEYRTDLDADRPAAASRRAFVAARAALDAANRLLRD